jgi:hypothetical protein
MNEKTKIRLVDVKKGYVNVVENSYDNKMYSGTEKRINCIFLKSETQI